MQLLRIRAENRQFFTGHVYAFEDADAAALLATEPEQFELVEEAKSGEEVILASDVGYPATVPLPPGLAT
jgi:hypothetical protein